MSYCCYAGDYDPADLENIMWRVANKPHRCCECRAEIPAGEEYQLVTLLSGGNWYRYKSCELCADLRESLEDVMCPVYEGLADSFTDWLTNGPCVMSVREGSHASRLVPGYFIDYSDG